VIDEHLESAEDALKAKDAEIERLKRAAEMQAKDVELKAKDAEIERLKRAAEMQTKDTELERQKREGDEMRKKGSKKGCLVFILFLVVIIIAGAIFATRNDMLSSETLVSAIQSIIHMQEQAPQLTAADYSKAFQRLFKNGTLGASAKANALEMTFTNVRKNENLYSVEGNSKFRSVSTAFKGPLTITSASKGGSCGADHYIELKGSYELIGTVNEAIGRFKGNFTACEISGILSKASFTGKWIDASTRVELQCDFEM